MGFERGPAPEKQLLNLIEKPDQGNIQQAALKRAGFSLFSWGALKGRLSFLKEKIRGLSSLKEKPLDIKGINGILCLVIFVLAAYFVTSFTLSVLNLDKNSTLDLEIKAPSQDVILKTSSSLKKLSYYLEKVRIRAIFSPLLTVREVDSITGESRRPISKISEVAANLKLVGISWSDDPDVLIENTSLGRVYILKRGEKINEVKIEAVFKDKVILSYEGEELTLR